MTIDPFWLIAAFGGGTFGAAIGGQTAFIMTGFLYLAGLAGYLGGVDVAPFMNAVVFGPVMGPHIAFLGGAIAVAYAAKKNYLPAGKNGRDVVTPLTTFGDHIDIYIVGGIGGMVGYLVNQVFALIPPLLVADPLNHYDREILGSTDTIAMTIVVVSIVVRYMYGTTGMFSTKQGPLMWVGDNKEFGDKHWVGYQEKWSHTSILGVTTGILSGFATLTIVLYSYESSGGAIVQHAANIGWAISAISLIFNTLGLKTPVTHHMTLIGSVAALKFAPYFAGQNPTEWTSTGLIVPLLLAGVFGWISAVLCEALSRATNANGDTHIDPPAFAIFPLTTLIFFISSMMG